MTNEVSNEMIWYTILAKKINFFLNSTIIKMKKKIIEIPRAQIFMKFMAWYFSMNLKQQNAFVQGEPMLKFL